MERECFSCTLCCELRLMACSTMRAETNSNDFGGFWNQLADSNWIFFVAKIIFLNDSNFWCVQSSITHTVAVHVHVLWPVCTHTISIPNVVVSVTIHDNIYINK